MPEHEQPIEVRRAALEASGGLEKARQLASEHAIVKVKGPDGNLIDGTVTKLHEDKLKLQIIFNLPVDGPRAFDAGQMGGAFAIEDVLAWQEQESQPTPIQESDAIDQAETAAIQEKRKDQERSTDLMEVLELLRAKLAGQNLNKDELSGVLFALNIIVDGYNQKWAKSNPGGETGADELKPVERIARQVGGIQDAGFQIGGVKEIDVPGPTDFSLDGQPAQLTLMKSTATERLELFSANPAVGEIIIAEQTNARKPLPSEQK